MTYKEKLRHPKWQKKRLEIFERDNYTCQSCGEKDKQLHVHHMCYTKEFPWDEENINLISICFSCHAVATEIDKISKNHGFETVSVVSVMINKHESYSINQSFKEKGETTPFKEIEYPFFK